MTAQQNWLCTGSWPNNGLARITPTPPIYCTCLITDQKVRKGGCTFSGSNKWSLLLAYCFEAPFSLYRGSFRSIIHLRSLFQNCTSFCFMLRYAIKLIMQPNQQLYTVHVPKTEHMQNKGVASSVRALNSWLCFVLTDIFDIFPVILVGNKLMCHTHWKPVSLSLPKNFSRRYR